MFANTATAEEDGLTSAGSVEFNAETLESLGIQSADLTAAQGLDVESLVALGLDDTPTPKPWSKGPAPSSLTATSSLRFVFSSALSRSRTRPAAPPLSSSVRSVQGDPPSLEELVDAASAAG